MNLGSASGRRYYALPLMLFVFPFFTVQAQTTKEDREKEYEIIEVGDEKGETVRLYGTIKSAENNEYLIGATIKIKNMGTGAITDQQGGYSITLSKGNVSVEVSYAGFNTLNINLNLRSSTILNVNLTSSDLQLDEIVVKDANSLDTPAGRTVMQINTIRELPAFMGEVDIIRSLLTQPGVSTVGEGASGFNVRGGKIDQNLVLLDDAPVFNPSHVFGFFSSFSGDAVQRLELFKSGIPSRYGGRASSILDVALKEGDYKKFRLSGGIGLVSAKLTVEGPLVKGKGAFIVSGRRSFSDYLLGVANNQDLRNSSASFEDVTAKLSFRLNDRNKLRVSAYTSRDDFSLASDTSFAWTNRLVSVQWNSFITKKISSQVTAFVSEYDLQLEGESNTEPFTLRSGVLNYAIKAGFGLHPNESLDLDFGVDVNEIVIEPGDLRPTGEASPVLPINIQDETGRELSFFGDSEIRLSPRFVVNAGLRFVQFWNVGERDVFVFEPGEPRTISSIRDTLQFESGEVIQSYSILEPRVSFRLKLDDISAIKGSYDRLGQFTHLISNTAASSPIDVWKLSNEVLKPLVNNQLSIGYTRNLKNRKYEVSVELYYKQMDELIEYKDGAQLLTNEVLETELLVGEGRSYGSEFSLRKTNGRLTGWINYTYSRSEARVDDPVQRQAINRGEYFPSNFDKPHDLSIFIKYPLSKRLIMSANFSYSTGRPITEPVTRNLIDGFLVLNYSDRNQFRIPDFHRLDVSFTIQPPEKQNKRFQGTWTFGAYNLYGRKNPFSVFFRSGNEFTLPKAFRLSVLGSIFPFLTYNFKLN